MLTTNNKAHEIVLMQYYLFTAPNNHRYIYGKLARHTIRYQELEIAYSTTLSKYIMVTINKWQCFSHYTLLS